MDVARAELAMLGDGDRVVITHSLSGLLWCRLAPTLSSDELPSRVLVTAPPTRDVLEDQVSVFAEPTGVRLDAVAPTLIVGRDTDDFRHSSLPDVANAWGAECVVVPGHGHLTPADGHGQWDAPLEWIRSGDPSVFAR
jgi:predicted alpha/beta hydrolase family esterase